jgi:hypothetical protein
VSLSLFNTVLGEELLFRGLLLPRMRDAFGRGDWLANGLLFAAYHLHAPWVIPTSLLDTFALAYPSRRYRSALIGIAVHSVQSLVLLALALSLASLTPHGRPLAPGRWVASPRRPRRLVRQMTWPSPPVAHPLPVVVVPKAHIGGRGATSVQRIRRRGAMVTRLISGEVRAPGRELVGWQDGVSAGPATNGWLRDPSGGARTTTGSSRSWRWRCGRSSVLSSAGC